MRSKPRNVAPSKAPTEHSHANAPASNALGVAVAVLTPEQLRAIVREELAAHGATTQKPIALTRQGLAEALDVSLATLDRMIARGEVPFFHVGDQKRFELDRVLESLRARGANGSEAAE